MAKRADRDQVLVDIADYVCDYEIDSDLAHETAHYTLMDTLACGFQALDYPACTRFLGPIVPGATLPGGARVPGTSYELDPVMAAFNIGAMNRWLDVDDTWLGAEWGHPSDNLGGILAVADYLSRQARAEGKDPLTMKDVLTAAIKAHEIHGVLALENSLNSIDLDHALLVRVATAAVVTRMLDGDREQLLNAVANAWIDGCSLRAYRYVPNTGSRTSWAAGDATSRGVRLALIGMTGEVGHYHALFEGNEFRVRRAYGSYVMDNVMFRISYENNPIGHRASRAEGIALLRRKFVDSVSPKLAANQWAKLDALYQEPGKLAETAVDDFMALLVT